MKPIVLAAASILLAAARAPEAPPADASALAWLSGTWLAQDETGWTEERWAAPRGGTMLGTSLSGRGDRASSYEFMRIAADDEGRLGFHASPAGQPPVRFRLVSASGQRVEFENPGNDYPTRIEYRRSANRLVATISGPEGRNPRTWRYRRAGD